MSGVRNSRNPSDCSVLAHSDNTVYAVRTFGAHPNCSAPHGRSATSHTPGPLSDK